MCDSLSLQQKKHKQGCLRYCNGASAHSEISLSGTVTTDYGRSPDLYIIARFRLPAEIAVANWKLAPYLQLREQLRLFTVFPFKSPSGEHIIAGNSIDMGEVCQTLSPDPQDAACSQSTLASFSTPPLTTAVSS